MTGSTLARAGVLLAALAGLAAGSGCNSSPELVANPTYQDWAGFEPGSSATLECTRNNGEGKHKVRIVQRLLENTPDRVVLERSVQVLDGNAAAQPVVTRKTEPAMINPIDNPRTRPEGHTKDLGVDIVRIKDRAFPCRVSEVTIHAEYGEPLPAVEDLRLRTWTNPEVPGGTARLDLDRRSASHSLELTGQVIDFHAVRRAK